MARKDKRVCFDFEVEFSNGGGIQGQGFRLDIDGDDIADEALAAYIIRDLRLLMVGEVRILNKQIVEERHKRSAATAETSESGRERPTCRSQPHDRERADHAQGLPGAADLRLPLSRRIAAILCRGNGVPHRADRHDRQHRHLYRYAVPPLRRWP